MLLAARCATSVPSQPPPLAASFPVERSRDDWVPIAYGGRTGVWVSEDALGDVLAGFEMEKGALRVEAARSKAMEHIATERATAIEKSAAAVGWRAQYGPWIGFLGGVILSACLVFGAVYAGKALANGMPIGGLQ